MKEAGAAGVKVELKDSRLLVSHGTTGESLLEGEVSKGAWDRIWNTFYSEIEKAVLEA